MWSGAPPRKTIGVVGDGDDGGGGGALDVVAAAAAAAADANAVADERLEGFARRTRHLHSASGRLVRDCSRPGSSHRDRSYCCALSLIPGCSCCADERNSTAVAVETAAAD